MSDHLFVKCSQPIITIREEMALDNSPVNLAYCSCIEYDEQGLLPQNKDAKDFDRFPRIKFRNIEKFWIYDNKEQRDEDYAMIMEKLFGEEKS